MCIRDRARTVALPWEVGNKVIGKGAETVSDDPETQAGIKYVGEILLGLLGGKAVHGAGKAVAGKVRGIAGDVPTSMPFPSEGQVAAVPVKQMIGAIKQLKPLRKEQEAMYTKERAQRFAKARGVKGKTSGESGYRAELSQLKGELQKVTFEPIREAFTQENIDFLFDEVSNNPLLSFTDTLTARKGLTKIFGEEGANLPTAGELQLLSRVFGKEFTSAVRSNWSTWKKVKHSIFETVNIPRSLMASFDASAPLRQGLMLIGRKEFYSSFKDMFKYFKGDKHKALLEDIAQRETYPLMQRSRLDLTEMGAALGKREERFMSHWGEKIPLGIGKGVEVSGRLYSGFLNKLRADVFDSLIKDAERLGLDPKGNPKLTQDIASFINSATGRGRLPVGDEMGTFLNSFFFSPRLVKARVDFMNPGWYMKLDPFARKQALKSLLTVAGAGMTTLGVAKALGGEVGDDPRSTDFGKIKVGNTRIDLWGGYQQYVVMASRLIANKTVSSTTGKVSQLGKGYKPNTRLGVLGRAVEYKEAPVFSFATALLKGQGAMGEDLKVEQEAMDRMIPMVIQDIVDIYKDDPNLLPLSALGVFGMGLQTYEPKKGIVR